MGKRIIFLRGALGFHIYSDLWANVAVTSTSQEPSSPWYPRITKSDKQESGLEDSKPLTDIFPKQPPWEQQALSQDTGINLALKTFCFILSIASTFSLGMESMRSLNSTRRVSTFTSFWTGLRLPTSASPMQTLYTWLIFLLRESISFSWD